MAKSKKEWINKSARILAKIREITQEEGVFIVGVVHDADLDGYASISGAPPLLALGMAEYLRGCMDEVVTGDAHSSEQLAESNRPLGPRPV